MSSGTWNVAAAQQTEATWAVQREFSEDRRPNYLFSVPPSSSSNTSNEAWNTYNPPANSDCFSWGSPREEPSKSYECCKGTSWVFISQISSTYHQKCKQGSYLCSLANMLYEALLFGFLVVKYPKSQAHCGLFSSLILCSLQPNEPMAFQ